MFTFDATEQINEVSRTTRTTRTTTTQVITRYFGQRPQTTILTTTDYERCKTEKNIIGYYTMTMLTKTGPAETTK